MRERSPKLKNLNKVLSSLIVEHGVAVNAVDSDGRSALHHRLKPSSSERGFFCALLRKFGALHYDGGAIILDEE